MQTNVLIKRRIPMETKNQMVSATTIIIKRKIVNIEVIKTVAVIIAIANDVTTMVRIPPQILL